MLRKIATYSVSNAIGAGLGLISFPIMARLLSYEDFGLLGFFQPHILILAGILKLGSQHSVIRFYPRVTRPGDRESHKVFATNFLWFPIIAGTLLAGLVVLGLVVSHRYFQFETFDYLVVVAFLSWSTAMFSVPQSYYVSRRNAAMHAATSIASSVTALCLILTTIIYIERSALGVFEARFVNGLLTSAVVLWLLWRRAPGHPSYLDRPTIRESLSYGLVLLCNEFAVVLLAFVDRYMIMAIIGDVATLGVYSLGYNLAFYITLLLGKPFLHVFTPTINKAFEEEGGASVRAIKRKAMELVAFPSALVATLLLISGQDAMQLLAGADKIASTPIFVWVGIGFTFLPFLNTWAFGLTLEKRSDLMLAATVAAVIANVVSNFLLLPRMGIFGAVVATMISYGVVTALRLLWCPKDFKIAFPGKAVLLPLALSVALYAIATATNLMGAQGPLLRLFVAGVLSTLVFVLPALFLDKNLAQVRRDVVARYLSR